MIPIACQAEEHARILKGEHQASNVGEIIPRPRNVRKGRGLCLNVNYGSLTRGSDLVGLD